MSKLNILIVDDEEEIREMLSEAIAESFSGEVGVVFAEDGVVALSKLRNQKFNLLISDIKMPRLDGMGLFKSCFSGVDNVYVPDNVLILSSEIPVKKNNQTIGRVHHLCKPFSREGLVSYLKGIFPDRIKT